MNALVVTRVLAPAFLALVLASATADAQRGNVTIKRVGASLEKAAVKRQTERATERFDPIFKKYTKRYFGVGTDWRRFKAQGMAESDLTPTARSRVGARGIMQLMPATYGLIKTALPQFGEIDNPEWNIAAGILHDRDLYNVWKKDLHDEKQRWDFVFAGYNAGEGTIKRARKAALAARLDDRSWESIESVAPKVERWRYAETLDYVRKIRANHAKLPPD